MSSSGRLRRFARPGRVGVLLALILMSVPAALATSSPAVADCPPDGCQGGDGPGFPGYPEPEPAGCHPDEFTMEDPDIYCVPADRPVPPPPEEQPEPPAPDSPDVPTAPVEEVVVHASRTLGLPLPAGRIRTPIGEHHSNRAAIDFGRGPDGTQLPNGTPVYAVEGGKVTYLDSATCGTGIQIDNGTHMWGYCHLSSRSIENGATVISGQQIGGSGSTGFLDEARTKPVAPHLHIQVRIATAEQRKCTNRPACLPPLRCPHPIVEALKAGNAPPQVENLPFYPCVR
jgi:hypothetical protein